VPRSPPAPVTATFFTAASVLQVVFDRFLKDGPLDHGNWRINENALRHLGAFPCTAAGKVVTCRMAAGVPFPAVDSADYLPPPFDVRSRHDLPAAGFLGFPLVVAP